jgi:hypothetical protein
MHLVAPAICFYGLNLATRPNQSNGTHRVAIYRLRDANVSSIRHTLTSLNNVKAFFADYPQYASVN